MATIKQVLRVYKGKIRQCPKCKSKKGFELNYSIVGFGMMQMSFKGKTLDAERSQTDILDHYANCLNCGVSIETERLQVD